MRLINGDALVYALTEMVRHSTGEYKHGIDAARLVAMEAPSVGGWTSVKDGLPKQHRSIFAPWYGRKEWATAMWLEESDRVFVTVKFPDGTRSVCTGKLCDKEWRTDVSRTLKPVVTHWMPYPDKPDEEQT